MTSKQKLKEFMKLRKDLFTSLRIPIPPNDVKEMKKYFDFDKYYNRKKRSK